ncbi:MAG: outer membrane beta-barrel protein, partial [Bacteroidales bacterium]
EFMNGYIIKNDGTYTYGQVKYIAKGYSVKECVFRWFDISTEYIFMPGEVEAFGFTHGMRYKAVSVGGVKSFMACLNDGELDLLYDGSRMYLDGMGLDMVPLGGNAGSVNADGKMLTYNGYRDLLEKLPDPENRFKVPSDLPLKPERMAEVIAAYNESRGVRAPVFTMRNPSGVYEEMRNLGAYVVNYGVLAGMNAIRFNAEKVQNPGNTFIPEMDFYEMTPLIGLWYNRPLKRGSDLLSVQMELMASRTNVYIYDETVNYSVTTRSDINFSYTGIKIPLYLKVSFLKGSFKPFINLGGFGMINLGTKYTREGEVENSLHVVRPFTDNTLMLNKSAYGTLAGVGIKKELNPRQSFSVEFRTESGTGIYDHDGIKQQILSFNVIAGFDFR